MTAVATWPRPARRRAFDLTVQVRTHPGCLPVEDAPVKRPDRLPPYVPVARLRLPASRFGSGAGTVPDPIPGAVR